MAQGYGATENVDYVPTTRAAYTISGTVRITENPKFTNKAPPLFPAKEVQLGELSEVPEELIRGFRTAHLPKVHELAINIFAPWVVFVWVFAAMAFSLRYWYPGASWFFFALGVVCVVASGGLALWRLGQEPRSAGLPCLMFVLMILSICLATFYGDRCFHFYVEPYLRLRAMNTYRNINPGDSLSAHVVDAGQVFFTSAARVDDTMAMGFMNHHTFCVAPITNKPLRPTGNTTSEPDEYNFWAVGINCCNGDQRKQDFRCGDVENDVVHAGLRHLNEYDMTDGETQKMFALAVTQAEAVYSIKAPHPLFLTWMLYPPEGLQKYMDNAKRCYVVWILYFLLFLIGLQVIIFVMTPILSSDVVQKVLVGRSY